MAEIRCLLHQTCEISKSQAAVLDSNRVHFYADLEQTVALMAHHLTVQGLGEGDRVAIFMHPSWPMVCTLMALIRIKAVAVPLSTRLPLEGLKSHLAAVQAHSLITEPAIAPDLEGVDVLIAEDFAEYVQLNTDVIPHHDLDQPAVVVFTSGSTGHPKPALLTYGNLYYSARNSNTNLQLSSNHKWMLSIPLYHVGGLGILFRCIESGATLVIPQQGVEMSKEIQSYEVTHLSLVPTQLIRLMNAADAKETARSLHTVLVGGAPIASDRILEAMELGFPIHTTYGMTEMSSQVATQPKYIPESKLPAVGRVLRATEVAITGDGEIVVRGKTQFAGYINGQNLEKPFDADGWYHTGDVGELDEDGYLTVFGRKDNMFISGGENIHPEEIERILSEQLKVKNAVVVPIADAEFGQRPLAFVEFPTGTTGDHLAHQLEEFLPRFKIPVGFKPWPEDAPDDFKIIRAWFQKRTE